MMYPARDLAVSLSQPGIILVPISSKVGVIMDVKTFIAWSVDGALVTSRHQISSDPSYCLAMLHLGISTKSRTLADCKGYVHACVREVLQLANDRPVVEMVGNFCFAKDSEWPFRKGSWF
jgi:hypothetical protein